MELLRIKCKVCGINGYGSTCHAVITEFKDKNPNKVYVQCGGCGTYAYRDKKDAEILTAEEILHD